MNLYSQSKGKSPRRYRGTGIGNNDLYDEELSLACVCLTYLSS